MRTTEKSNRLNPAVPRVSVRSDATRGRAEGRAAHELQSAANPRAKDKMKIITSCRFYFAQAI